MEIDYSFQLLCSGIELRHPQARFDNEKFVMQFGLRQTPLRIDEYCDNMWQEGRMLSPYMISKEDGGREAEELEKNLKLAEDSRYFYYWKEPMKESWFGRRAVHHEMSMISPIMHWVSTYYPFKDHCEKNYPSNDPSRCAFVHVYAKKHNDYNSIMDWDRTYFDYSDEEAQKKPLIYQRNYTRYFLHFGLLLYLLGIKVNRSLMIWTVFLVNLALQCGSLYMPFRRFGPDTTAYINQAGQFISGQTDYSQISSVQGPCYYPAGHLWHYVPIYYMYLATDQAEQYLKLLHIVALTVVSVLVSKIAYNHFKTDPLKA